jgi:hypothetical protein
MATVTPTYSWPVPTSTDYVADGAVAIEALGDAIDSTVATALGGAYPGLRLVKKQTIGTTVSSVTVNDAFSATYENYRILVTGGTQSSNTTMTLKLGASTTQYYGALIFQQYSNTGTILGTGDNNSGAFTYVGGGDSNASYTTFELMSPQLAKYTRLYGGRYTISGTTGSYDGIHQVATAYTSFIIAPASGTLTGGTIYVYGFGAS